MKIIEVKALAISDIKVIKFARFCDERGYFSEPFRKSDFLNSPELPFMKDVEFVQSNESFSKKKTIRGLHFQWNPYMGKLVRTLKGRMVDLVLDIRKGSQTFGKIIAYDMPNSAQEDYSEWIWIPPGFAHGNFFIEESAVEYLCTGEWAPATEAGISPLANDIDWSLCDSGLREEFEKIAKNTPVMSDKDRDAPSVSQWKADKRSDNFVLVKS